ncbi:PTS sugar transporter subunit IIC [Vagococcus carniphilus]|uniref:PTS sugar transporter subunit IIC n=1 Tax=Vagococcus carniphilus TaxID=218144 RepID=UPI0028905CB4|nr:PTS sugar transporter subunit IIC [Vagococcus carniphilus]MDT2814199.1 PTS sugar transporter subunit IIC [Vagococcus carniphilus]MDT2829317.1 PTS sugar transporter subunit IIC [Vagococcus carniphilus]MDT2838776.1 PTS sugar transporter subunit IIC [Vagococcus carniphilus]MDT2849071.1 PTS sugar transporter subunit IIC [Vagococcus carniphilus]MDT2852834.1 PTS sugar transporter subunit IIC [Vagococcus carniphilus]
MTNEAVQTKMTPKVFFNKLLAGTAQGTIIALIPNAVLGAILKYFADIAIIQMIIHAAQIFQVATPLIIAALVAKQFDLTPPKMMIVGGAAFAGSGVIKFDAKAGAFIAAGTGDIINIMITASVAVLMMMWIKSKFGSVEIIALPIVVGIGAGLIGMLTYPYVTQITAIIGNVINTFTDFQPIVASILIACSFAALIISPITTVAIGMAIQLNGVSAGAAAMGIAATTVVLVINSWKVNESGVTLAVALGGMKMMMPNLFKYPIILVPCLFTATVSAIPVALFNISGTPNSAGFGLVGLVGPLASLDAGLNVLLLIISWFVVPIAAGLFAKFLFEKVLKLYDSSVVFAYQG